MLQLERACEAMARLINGQMFPMQDICEFAWERHVQKPKGLETCGNEFFDMRHEVENCLNALHILCWDITVGTDYGLHHSPDSDILWDMYQVFRHQRFLEMPKEEQERSRMLVMADEPWQTGKEPLCKVVDIEEIETNNKPKKRRNNEDTIHE